MSVFKHTNRPWQLLCFIWLLGNLVTATAKVPDESVVLELASKDGLRLEFIVVNENAGTGLIWMRVLDGSELVFEENMGSTLHINRDGKGFFPETVVEVELEEPKDLAFRIWQRMIWQEMPKPKRSGSQPITDTSGTTVPPNGPPPNPPNNPPDSGGN